MPELLDPAGPPYARSGSGVGSSYTAGEGTAQTPAMARARRTNAIARSPIEPTPMKSCSGPKNVSAPEEPMAATTILLQTGQPTAMSAKNPPATVLPACSVVRETTNVPASAPTSGALSSQET